jgi:hypothetical protein
MFGFGLDSPDPGLGPVAGSCVHGNNISCSREELSSMHSLKSQIPIYFTVQGVTVTVYSVASHKAPHTLRPLLVHCASPSDF